MRDTSHTDEACVKVPYFKKSHFINIKLNVINDVVFLHFNLFESATDCHDAR